MTFIDLKNTELVVLSACNTGLGKIVNGNGVIGLQRAVLLSGAKKLIMSLGEISDTASMLLMEKFYRRYRESLDVEKSLREAKLAIIRENIKKYGHAAPSRWGSYVCLSRSF